MTRTHFQLSSFIGELDIPVLAPSAPGGYRAPALTLVRAGQKAAQVNCGSLVSFVEGLGAQNKADVQNSTLLAQLAANKKYDRMTDVINWFQFYTEVLQTVGWNVPNVQNEKYTPTSSSFTLSSVIVDILQGVANETELDLVQATTNALKSTSADSSPMKIWSGNGFRGSFGNFQILPVTQSPEGDVAMVLCAIQCKSDAGSCTSLWQSATSQQMEITRSAARYLLNNDVYSQVRDSIIQKLGVNATTFIADLDI